MKWTHLRSLLAAAALLGAAASASAGPWFPPSEPAPFVPDAARFIAGPGHHPPARPGAPESGTVSYARGTWQIAGPVKRAVLYIHSTGAIRAFFDGRLVLEAGQREWADFGPRLKPGALLVALRSYGDWGANFYAQMRVEYRDGTVVNLVTKPDGWEIAATPAADWTTNPKAGGDWQPAKDAGGYHPEPGKAAERHQEFAPLPREQVKALVADHNARLRAEWGTPGQRPPLRLDEPAGRPEWQEQFRANCRLNEHGELLDGAGKVRHLVFALYTCNGAYTPMSPEFDWDQYERDLKLMADAEVHLYMRATGMWQLLDKQGEWIKLPVGFKAKGSNLPRFEYAVDVLDYFVRRAYAMGRYIQFESDFYWNAPTIIPWAYRGRYHLYPELVEASALEHRKVYRRYADCPNVLGCMIGEEDILVDYDLANTHQHALFVDYLKRRYGTLAAFKQAFRRGYDYTDISAYTAGKSPEDAGWTNWRNLPREDVLVPGFVLKRGVFDRITSWDQIPLPAFPEYRSPVDPSITLGGHRNVANDWTPYDPLWPDFYRFQQDERYYGFASQWARIVREAWPGHLMYFCNAQDSEGSFHWPELHRRADLPFDVIGVGDHDYDTNLRDMPPWTTLRKAIKTIASYRAYARTPGGSPKGIATGEGEIGKKGQWPEIVNGYLGYFFDEIGGGGAWTQTYTWVHMAGGDTGAPNTETPFLKWCGPFLRAVQGVSFQLDRKVRVLIVRNLDLENSNISGMDYGDALTVADALSRLNVDFDIVMGRDLSCGPSKLHVDLTPYQLVIVPNACIDQPAAAWEALDRWLTDPKFAGKRALAIGRIDPLDGRLQPAAGFSPLPRKWLGGKDYQRRVSMSGAQTAALTTPAGKVDVPIDIGKSAPTGVPAAGAPFLTVAGQPVGKRIAYGGNSVFAFGFPLGLTTNVTWGSGPQQKPVDALVPLYEQMAAAVRLDRPVLAPHNLRVAVSDDGRMILIRERQGLATDCEVAVRLPAGVEFEGLPVTRGADGYARFAVHLEAWGGVWWKAK